MTVNYRSALSMDQPTSTVDRGARRTRSRRWVLTGVGVAARGGGGGRHDDGPRDTPGAVLRGRRHAPGPGRAVRAATRPTPATMPAMAELLKKGVSASDGGLLTQAPPNTGAGWYSLATGAWPAVTGSTNNTFHINGAAVHQPHGRVRCRRAAGRDRSPSPPSAAARRWSSSSWPVAAGRRHTARRSTSAASSPAAAWPPTTSRRPTIAAFTASFGLQFDHPAGFAGQAPFPGPLRRRDRVDERAGQLQPGQGDAPAGPGLRRRQVRPQRLHLRQHQRRRVNYDQVLFSPSKDGAAAVGTLPRGSGRTSR